MPVRKYNDSKWQARRTVRLVAGNKADALRFDRLVESAVAEARRRWRDAVVPCCSIGDKLEEFLDDSEYGLGRRPRGYATLKRHRRRLAIFDRVFQRLPLDAIGRDRVERWIKRRLDEGVSPDTVNADLISLRAFARWARDKGHAPQHIPLLTVARPHSPGKLAGRNRKPPRVREMGEIKRIIARIGRDRPDMRLFLLGMALFGRRPKAVATWKREHVKLPRAGENGRLKTRGVKGGLEREIAIPPGSPREAWIRECLSLGKKRQRARPRDPLVPCLGSRSQRNPGGWTTESFDMALARVVNRLRLRFTAYEIRHSCVSWLQTQKDIALANTQGYADHARITTQEAYSHRHNAEAEIAYRMMEVELEGL